MWAWRANPTEQRKHSADASLLDHLIRSGQQRRRDREPHGLRRLEVDDEPELRRLLHGKIAGLRALEDLVDVARGAPKALVTVRPIAAQSSRIDIVSLTIQCGQPGSLRELGDPCEVDEECTVPRDEEAARMLPPCRFKRFLEVARSPRLHRLQLHPQRMRRYLRFLQG